MEVVIERNSCSIHSFFAVIVYLCMNVRKICFRFCAENSTAYSALDASSTVSANCDQEAQVSNGSAVSSFQV